MSSNLVVYLDIIDAFETELDRHLVDAARHEEKLGRRARVSVLDGGEVAKEVFRSFAEDLSKLIGAGLLTAEVGAEAKRLNDLDLHFSAAVWRRVISDLQRNREQSNLGIG